MSSFMSLLNHSNFFPSDLFRSYEGTLNKSYQGSNNLMLTYPPVLTRTIKTANKSSSPDFMDSDSSSSYKTNQSLETVTKKIQTSSPETLRSAKTGSSAKERSKGAPRCPPSQPVLKKRRLANARERKEDGEPESCLRPSEGSCAFHW
ncbi:BHLH domain-containing protein [Caerostris extrusa]|uniref:BHLH domain-containing protein n=1 Tax=Caerostris extrusa TaxID=172846 RepID=A0AAV4NMV8_CAEEX|nr:BHLH domain-containing protein [Caerostris extrusa]